ncbi:GNAT family N-acetyltransferase [Streptomyces sp. NPDC003470]|uniref:GNAT family N-acetyltransferase n=1 Tax=Streptomyces sp. NPDC127100 TaxID=3347138 RepID=UPI0036533D29
MSVAAEGRYRWHNSTDPRLVRLHHAVDTLTTLRPRVTVSYPEDGTLTVAYAGLDAGLDHVLPFLEQRRGPTALREERRTTWARLAAHGVPEADLLAVGCPAGRTFRPPARQPTVVAPFRIGLVVPLDTDRTAVPARLSRKSRQQYQREQRTLDRTLEVGTTRVDFAFFYDRMHRPTMLRRHGAATRSVPRETAWQSLFRHGVLFFLRERGERVAGMLCRLEPGTLVLRLAGVLDGSAERYRSGTYIALYVAILEWAQREGLRRVDLSGAEPFLSKGIVQFKRKLHPHVASPATHFTGKRLWLWVRRDTPAVRDFLVANPVLAQERGGLRATYFHDSHRAPRTDLRWETSGVVGATRVDLDDFLTGVPCAVSRAGSTSPGTSGWSGRPSRP